MKLVFLYHPVKNLKESLAFYRETMGFEEAWREGETTAVLKLPETEIQLMIEEDEQNLEAGGVFLVDHVDDFYQKNKENFEFVKEPVDIPPGRYAIYKDLSGNYLRILDFTNEK